LIWYDRREVNWTPSTLEDIVEDMGYEVEGGSRFIVVFLYLQVKEMDRGK
jgi:hypothetical protein